MDIVQMLRLCNDNISNEAATEIMRLRKSEFYGLTFHDPNYDAGKATVESGKTIEEAEAAGESLGLERYQQIYQASSKLPTERHTLPDIDGATGMSSVQRIGEAIGLTLKRVITKSKNQGVYILEDKAA